MQSIHKPEQNQRAVVQFLSDPRSHGLPGDTTIPAISTHAAIVFLAGAYAYKIKRAVRLAYLDFTALSARRSVVEREIELNTRTAPDIYLAAVPIFRRPDGTIGFEGSGEVVEWAVKMRRFDNDRLLDRLAQRGQLALAACENLALEIAVFHQDAALEMPDGQRPGDKPPSVMRLRDVCSTTASALLDAPDVIETSAGPIYRDRLLAEFDCIAPRLEERAAAGYVRRCHGDLHLKNVVLLDDRPVLFDALEFDDSLATIDVLYDLAFLLMDLWQRDLRAHANIVLNRYLTAWNDDRMLPGLAALPLFQSLRAAVRAMVAIDRLKNAPEGKADASDAQDARRYFDWANRFLDARPVRLVAVGGRSGTGKSTIARAIAPALGAAPGAVHLRSDVIRKELFGVSETTRLPTEAYTLEVSHKVYDVMATRAAQVLKSGHSVVLDSASLRPDERASAEGIARAAGARFAGIWLDAPAEVLERRVSNRVGGASDADAFVVRQQLARDVGPVDWHRVSAEGQPAEVEAVVLELLDLD